MCFGMFGFGECCPQADQAGTMDFYWSNSTRTHMSSGRFFSRASSNTTQAKAGSGRQTETLWGVERANPDKHRSIGQSVAPAGTDTVWQLEVCSPMMIDEKLPISFSAIGARDPSIYPIIDPTGEGWIVSDIAQPKNILISELFRTNIAIETVYLNLAQESFGVILRYVDKDNYLVFRFDWTAFNARLEKVVAGATTIIQASAQPISQFALGGRYQIFTSLDSNTFAGNITHLESGAVCNFSGINIGTAPAGTKHGLYKTSNVAGTFVIVRISTLVSSSKSFISCYNAGQTATINGQYLNTRSYKSNKFAAGSLKCFQPKGGLGILPPGYSGVGVLHYGSVWDGGQEISKTGAATLRENLALQGLSFFQTIDPTRPPQQYNASLMDLGLENVGVIAKHAYPYSCGLLLKSVTATSVSYGPDHQLWTFKGKWGVYVGQLVYTGSFAPTVPQTEEVATFEIHTLYLLLNNVVPSENFIRYTLGFARDGTVIVPVNVGKFDCTPDGQNWVCATSYYQPFTIQDSITLFNSSFGQINGATIGAYLPDKAKANGVVYDMPTNTLINGYALFTKQACVSLAGNFGGFHSLRMYGDKNWEWSASNVPGLTFGYPICMSDRFLYANLSFYDLTSATAWCTAPNKNKIAVNPSGPWAISLDGTIRFPLQSYGPPYNEMAWSDLNRLNGSADIPLGYDFRSKLEKDGATKYPALSFHMFDYGGFGGGERDLDCIKNSSIPQSPPLANPDF